MYKLKGSGDTRDVWSVDVLVGRLHRTEQHEITGRVNLKRGVASFTKRTVVRWEATWRDTNAPVMVGLTHGPHRESFAAMKTWTSPDVWQRCIPEGS